MTKQILNDIVEIISRYTIANVTVGAVYLLCLLFITCWIGRRQGREKMRAILKVLFVLFLFIVYVCFVVELTLLTREEGSRIGVSLQFFGTYAPDMMSQCWMVENLILFLPFGVLVPSLWYCVRGSKGKRALGMRVVLLTMGTGLLSSLMIECTQHVTGRGYFQVDDIWLNTLGAVVGALFWCVCYYFGVISGIASVIFLMLFGMIFGFSAQTGTQSSGISDVLARMLSDGLRRVLHIQVAADRLTFPIRKTAHMTEYALLWLDTYIMISSGRRHLSVRASKQKISGNYWRAFIPVLLVSMSDEFHQLFVPGRSGQVIDVGWDMLGVCLCMLFVGMFCHLFRRKDSI